MSLCPLLACRWVCGSTSLWGNCSMLLKDIIDPTNSQL